MAKQRIRTAVVGTGFGRYHMEGYAQLEGVELVAICDLNEPEAREFADKYGVQHVFTDYREMFSMDGLDAVSIAVPNCLHAPMAIDALSKGKHVLVEKPMTISVADAEVMAAAARKAGKRLMVEQALRFRQETQLLRAYAEQGLFGEVYFAKSVWTRRKGWPRLNFAPGATMGRGEWFIRKDEAGYGALGDIGVHLIDLAWYMMGLPKPVSVSGGLWTKVANPLLKRGGLPIEVDEFAAGFIRFENGAVISADVCWDTYNEPAMQTLIFGDKAGASLFPPRVFKGEDIMETISLDTTNGAFTPITAYSHFIDCVRDPDLPMIASGEENITLIQILCAIQESARTGYEVRLD